MKFFLGGLYQESNSFCPTPTGLALFQREKLIEGDPILDEIRGSNLELAGMAEELARRFPGAVVAAGLHAWGIASGPLEDAAFAELSGRMLARLRAALPVDAVLLALHGSMGAESYEDCEGELLGRVRQLVGPGIPIAVSFDFHAVITAKILRAADVVAGYRTYPHVDQAATGRRTVAALDGWLRSDSKWQLVVRRWPAIIPVENAQTDSGPMSVLAGVLGDFDRDPDVLTASMFCPHPWYDTSGHGATLLAFVRPSAATRAGEQMEAALRRMWERRSEFIVPCLGPEDFFRNLRHDARPVAAIDTGDVTTAGAPGNSTVILRAAQTADVPCLLVPLVDPNTVAQAEAIGAGGTAEFRPGGSDQPGVYNSRTALRAEVVRLASGPFRMTGASFGGMSLNPGPRALLRCGSINVLAMNHSSWFHDPELWRSVGVEPAAAGVILQKSHKLFQPAYAGITRATVAVETPGCTDRRLSRLPYRRVIRPIFPLDDIATFCTLRSI